MPPDSDIPNPLENRSDAEPGSMIWAQPGICENILSHLEADEQVRLMSINNNAFKAVLGRRYRVIGGYALSHLVSAGTPQVSLHSHMVGARAFGGVFLSTHRRDHKGRF